MADQFEEESYMGFLSYVKDAFTLASILSLLTVGLWITLKSGVVSVGNHHCRLVLSNLSHLILGVAGCLIVLMMLQQIVGIR
jgi:hypothetical protein